MNTYYYVVQILTMAEAASMLILLRLLLYAADSGFVFEHRNKILRTAAAVMLFSANLLLAVSAVVNTVMPAGNGIGRGLAVLIDFMTLIIGAGALVTFAVKGKNAVLRKEQAEIVRIPVKNLVLHTNIRPFPFIQAGETEANQTGVWTEGGKQNTLIFVGGTPEEPAGGSEMVAEIVPHNEEPGVYYVTRFMVKGKKAVSSRVLTVIGAIAAAMFVLSFVFMNHDCLVLGMQLPYPEGYPSVSLLASAAGTMLLKYICAINGKAHTKQGSAAAAIFKAACWLLLAICFISLCGSFARCCDMYLPMLHG